MKTSKQFFNEARAAAAQKAAAQSAGSDADRLKGMSNKELDTTEKRMGTSAHLSKVQDFISKIKATRASRIGSKK